MEHVDDELLAALALGDDDELTAGERAHVAGCDRCRLMVDELRGTLALTRATADSGERLVAPGPGVRERVLSAASVPAPVPPAPRSATRSALRRVPAWLAVAASVTAFGAGGVAGLLIAGNGDESPSTPVAVVVAKTELSTLSGDAARGSAQVVRGDGRTTLQVRATSLAQGGGTHEVWLINEDGKRMVALGFLSPQDDGSFLVPAHLLAEGYRIVDVSVEPDDGNPVHSGTSLARGRL